MRANRPSPAYCDHLDEADQTERGIIIEEMIIPNKANQTLSIRIQRRVNKGLCNNYHEGGGGVLK